MNGSTGSQTVVTDPSDAGHLEHLSIPELLSFLKSSFLKADFDKVETIWRRREASARAEVERRLSMELTRKEMKNTELEERCRTLERELVGLRSKNFHAEERVKKAEEDFRVLSVEQEKKHKEARERYALLENKFSELEFEKFMVSEELEKYKKMCLKLEELVARREEDYKVMRGREQRAVEKIASLLEERRKELNEKFVALKVEDMDFGSNKKIAGTEVRGWRSKFSKVDQQISQQIEEENMPLKRGKLETCREMGEEKGSKETMKQVKNENDVGWECQLLSRIEADSKSKVDPIVATRSNPTLGAIIEISDSEDDLFVTASGFTEHSADKTAGTKDTGAKVSSKNQQLGLRTEGAGEGCSKGKENLLSTLKPKRRRDLRISTCESEGEDDENKIPKGKLKMKRLEEVIAKPMNSHVHCSPANSSDNNNLQGSLTTCRQQLFPAKQNKETKGSEDGISLRGLNSITQTLLSTIVNDVNSRDKGGAFGKREYPTGKNLIENEAQEGKEVKCFSQDSEVENSGESSVNWSDVVECESYSSDALEEEVRDSSLDQMVRRICKKKDIKGPLKWEYEADMLSSFSMDPNLCMEAVCALYRQQTAEEKDAKGSLLYNGRGFNTFDAYKGSRMAEFLMDGNTHGPLKRSIEELEKYDPEGLNYCCKLATHYSRQLFSIYQSKEDPCFLPS